MIRSSRESAIRPRSWLAAMSLLRYAAASCAFACALSVDAGVVFSSFGPGLGYDASNGVSIDGPATAFPQGLAEPFAPTASSTLDSVEFAASTSVGVPQLNVRIYADLAGSPGDLLEDVQLASFPNGVATANFSGQLVLGGGTTYWLGLFTPGSNHQVWHDSTSGAFALQAASSDDGATWSTLSSDPFPRAAFRVNGTPVAPPDVSLIPTGAAWRFFRGLAEPSVGTQWTTTTFADGAWDFGVEGFGYDANPATQAALMSHVGTPLPDMREDGINPDAFTALYLRRSFTVADPATLTELVLQLDYDDSFIAYVNGVEVARSPLGTPGIPEPFDALGVDHESTNGDPGKPLARFAIDLANDFPGLLHAGADNVLALQGLNAALDDDDFVLARISLGANSTISPSADFDGNGSVNAADLSLWRTGFGVLAGAGRPQGDADGNGRVDGADFLEWQRQCGAGAATSAAHAIPEPSTIALLLISATAVASLTRPWRCQTRRHFGADDCKLT